MFAAILKKSNYFYFAGLKPHKSRFLWDFRFWTAFILSNLSKKIIEIEKLEKKLHHFFDFFSQLYLAHSLSQRGRVTLSGSNFVSIHPINLKFSGSFNCMVDYSKPKFKKFLMTLGLGRTYLANVKNLTLKSMSRAQFGADWPTKVFAGQL